MSDFATWLDAEYTRMASEYRVSLERKCIEFERIVKGFTANKAHVDIAIECLREIPIPAINKYQDATEADKQHFKTALKPNWSEMLEQSIKRCQAVLLVNKV